MSYGRQQRVMDGREKFLQTTESIGKDFDVTADAILHCSATTTLAGSDNHLVRWI
jgi:hypothetical protein